MPEIRKELWRKGIDAPDFERALRGSISERALGDFIHYNTPERMQELYRAFRMNNNFESKLKSEPVLLAERAGIPYPDFQALAELGAPLGVISQIKHGFEGGLIKSGDISAFVSRFDREVFSPKEIMDSYLLQLRLRLSPPLP